LCGINGYFSFLTPQSLSKSVSESARPIFLMNYPDEWPARYLKKCYHFVDPVIVEGRKSRHPYLRGGKRYFKGLHIQQRAFFGEAGSYGITFPVHGPDGECSFFTVASDAQFGDFEELVRATTPSNQLIALSAHVAAIEYILDGEDEAEDIPNLTDRERECLLWTAQGKTSWEDAQIIGRSTASVNFHLQKAIRKTGANNKVHAAFLAYERKLLF
jgi:LuxR family transcriptional activator of conjugal transfer of Ti plasmids